MSTRDELRQRIKQAATRRYAEVEVPGGDKYTVRSLSLREKGENESLLINSKTGAVNTANLSRQKCDLLCRSVVDPDDKQPLFDPSEWEVWADADAPVTIKLLSVIDKLNEGQSVEGLLGNSDTTGG